MWHINLPKSMILYTKSYHNRTTTGIVSLGVVKYVNSRKHWFLGDPRTGFQPKDIKSNTDCLTDRPDQAPFACLASCIALCRRNSAKSAPQVSPAGSAAARPVSPKSLSSRNMNGI